MTPKPIGPVVVNYPQIARMFGDGSREAVSAGLTNAVSSPEDEAILGRALAALEDTVGEHDVLCAPDDQAAALLQTFLSERALDDHKLGESWSGAREARFDHRDVGWVRAAVPWIRDRLGRERRVPRPPLLDEPGFINDHCRIAVLGDWGTGLYGARPAANTIAREANYDVLLHLGDVYYSGAELEIKERFLDIWVPMATSSPGSVSRACNSNHEMYSGGGPFFELTLPALQQRSPVFILENQYWVLVGLDTAYDDHDLDDDQVQILNQVVDRLGGRRLVLISHHQPFSLLAGQGPRLTERLRHLLEGRRIFAWYWGHEHLLALYEAHPRWGLHGRCVGHSGFPYSRPDFGGAATLELADEHVFRTLTPTATAPGAQVLDGPNAYLGDRRHKYGPNGFMRVELEGPHLYESVVTPSGVVLWEGRLT